MRANATSTTARTSSSANCKRKLLSVASCAGSCCSKSACAAAASCSACSGSYAAANPKVAKSAGVPQSVAKKMVKEGQSSLKKLPKRVKK